MAATVRRASYSGLYDELRPGRPRTISDDKVASLLRHTLKTAAGRDPLERATSGRGQPPVESTIHGVFQTFALQPHLTKTFKLSNDPFFVEKVRDIVGLYLNPPDHAIVLAVDEKSQIQVLSRTQPVMPMGLGYIEGVTHDYVRHDTTTLFAALDVATGPVFTECKARHRHQEFLAFLKAHQQRRSCPSGCPSDRRQLRHPQAWQSTRLAGPKATFLGPLHADILFVAQPGGTLVWLDYSAGHSPW
jgi:hypothetical protein